MQRESEVRDQGGEQQLQEEQRGAVEVQLVWAVEENNMVDTQGGQKGTVVVDLSMFSPQTTTVIIFILLY